MPVAMRTTATAAVNSVAVSGVPLGFTLDVRDLPLKHMMRALLEANDCAWHEDGGLIRVQNTETHIYPTAKKA